MFDLRLLLVTAIWGVNFSLVKFALADFYPLGFTIVRFSLATLFLLVLMIINREPRGIERRDIAPLLRLGFIGITLYNILFMEGLRFTTASNSALFIATSPLFAALAQSLSGKERITRRSGLGFLLSTIGAALVIGSRLGSMTITRQNLAGDLLTLAAAFSWALYTMQAGPLLEKYSPVKVSAYSMAAGTVFLLPFGIHDLANQPWRAISCASWAALGFAAFFAGGLAYALWYRGVKKLGAASTIVYHYLMPFVAVLFAAVFLGEPITLLQIAGGGAILGGVALVQRSRLARPRSD